MSIKTIPYPNFEWIDLINPSEEELKQIADTKKLNYFNLVDSVEPNHLPKLEAEGDYTFFIVRFIKPESKNKDVSIEALSNKIAVWYNTSTIITIHRVEIDFLTAIENKIIKNNKPVTTNSFIINMLWHVINTYAPPITNIFTHLDYFEDKLFLKHVPKNMLQQIYLLRRRANLSRKILFLTEGIIESVKPARNEKPAYHDMKDLYVKLSLFHDQVMEDLNNLLNIYLSISSQKSNEIMKTLTIFSIFFMPITFIAGVYGMNFEIMPELKWIWGYPIIMLLMALICLFIYLWLKRKKWI